MDIRNLNTFLLVASLQNFTKASQELGYSQSNVSAQIKQLEQEVGAPLFDRIGKRVVLTSYGEQLIPYARQVVSTALKIETFLKSEDSMRGTVRAGMVESLFAILLEDAFLRYHSRFPGVNMELTVDAASALKDRLRHGQLDFACLIDDPLPSTEWYVWDWVDVPVVVVSNPEHPLAKQREISPEDLVAHEWILMEESASYSIHFQRFLADEGLEIRPILKLQSAQAACRLVEQGEFLSVLPLYAVQSAAAEGRVAILPVPQWNQIQRVQLALHRSKILTPQMEGFLEELLVILQDMLKEP